jgi:hypothetical protein
VVSGLLNAERALRLRQLDEPTPGKSTQRKIHDCHPMATRLHKKDPRTDAEALRSGVRFDTVHCDAIRFFPELVRDASRYGFSSAVTAAGLCFIRGRIVRSVRAGTSHGPSHRIHPGCIHGRSPNCRFRRRFSICGGQFWLSRSCMVCICRRVLWRHHRRRSASVWSCGPCLIAPATRA